MHTESLHTHHGSSNCQCWSLACHTESLYTHTLSVLLVSMPQAPRSKKQPGRNSDGEHSTERRTGGWMSCVSYNVGVNNNEIQKIQSQQRKYKKLRTDIKTTFTSEHSITIMLMCEFGNMFSPLSNLETKEVFEMILRELDLQHIQVFANAPYVALIDTSVWLVVKREMHQVPCRCDGLRAQQLIVKDVKTDLTAQLWNSHIPTSVANKPNQRFECKKQCVEYMATKCRGYRDHQGRPTPWLIAGDLNLPSGALMVLCQSFIVPDSHCISKSKWLADQNAQSSDIAMSQGIALQEVKAFIGKHSDPEWCASDAHDAVVVIGKLIPKTMMGHISSGIHHAADNSGQNQVAAPESITTATPMTVNDSGGGHPAASNEQGEPAATDAFSAVNASSGLHSTANPTAPRPESLAEMQPNDTGEKCYNCGTPTSSPIRLENAGVTSVCSYIACSPSCSEKISYDSSCAHYTADNPDEKPVISTASTPNNGYKERAKPHITDAYLKAASSTTPDHVTNKSARNSDYTVDTVFPWPAASSTLPKDYNQDHTRDSTHATAKSAASQGNTPRTPPALILTRIAQISAGVDDEPGSPDWYKSVHNTWEDDIPLNQGATSAKISAAQKLLDTLFVDGTKMRDPEYMTQPIRRRDEYIHAIARTRGTTRKRGMSDWSYGYTEDEWICWYNNNPLESEDITEVMKQWSQEFFEKPETEGGMKDKTKQKILQLERVATSNSKKDAKELRRGAFKAFLGQQCDHKRQLAMLFLIYPQSACDEILRRWTNYMTDEAYELEVKRSKPISKLLEDTQALADRKVQKQRTTQAHEIKQDYKRMLKVYRKTSTDPERGVAAIYGYPYVPKGLTGNDKVLYEEFESGALIQKVNHLTDKHGFGRLYTAHGSIIIGSQRMLSCSPQMDGKDRSEYHCSTPWTQKS